MRTAVLERFGQASRRCEPATIGTPADEMQVWELAHRCADVRTLIRDAPGAAACWLRLPSNVRWKLLRACLRTGGARAGALVAAPRLLRRIREGHFTTGQGFVTFLNPDAAGRMQHLASRQRLLKRTG